MDSLTTATGTFEVEDAFYITRLGLVLAGRLTGTVVSGQQLLFADGRRLPIRGVNSIVTRTLPETAGLLVANLTTRAEAAASGIIGATAQVVA